MANIKQNSLSVNLSDDKDSSLAVVNNDVSYVRKRVFDLERRVTHSNLFALCGILCSVLSLVFTFYFSSLQNQKWDILNQATIDIKNARLIAFDEIDFNELDKREWLVPPIMYPVIKDGIATKKYRLHENLYFWDNGANVPLLGSKLMLTKTDVEEEVKRLKLEDKINKELVSIRKHYLIEFSFKNTGQLSAKNLKFDVDMILEDGIIPIVKDQHVSEIVGSAEGFITGELWIPINIVFPPEVPYKVTVSYVTDSQRKTRTINYVYDTKSNRFLLRQ